MGTILRKARPGEESTVFDMIADRVGWMDRNGIHQWNETDYLEVYPLEYYRQNLDNLYVLADEDTGRILCAAILFRQDERWSTAEPSFYIHNFVSALDSHGAGRIFLQQAEVLAKTEDSVYLRLDSADDNPLLSAYYEKQGFEACGVCHDGKYHGTLRQKKLQI